MSLNDIFICRLYDDIYRRRGFIRTILFKKEKKKNLEIHEHLKVELTLI